MVNGRGNKIAAHFTTNPDRVRGEFVVVVEGV
jgi:hypothetical protein